MHMCTERVNLLSAGPLLSPEVGFHPVALSECTLCAPLLISSCSAHGHKLFSVKPILYTSSLFFTAVRG